MPTGLAGVPPPGPAIPVTATDRLPWLFCSAPDAISRAVCSLGNFATKLLSGSPAGITKVRGVPQVRRLGAQTVFLYPIFHPAAALRTPAMLDQLRADFQAIPGLLEQEPPPLAEGAVPEPEEPDLVAAASVAEVDQLGLF